MPSQQRNGARARWIVIEPPPRRSPTGQRRRWLAPVFNRFTEGFATADLKEVLPRRTVGRRRLSAVRAALSEESCDKARFNRIPPPSVSQKSVSELELSRHVLR